MKRQRSHRRHRRRDASRGAGTSTKAIRRWFGALERMNVPLDILFGPLILWCGPPR